MADAWICGKKGEKIWNKKIISNFYFSKNGIEQLKKTNFITVDSLLTGFRLTGVPLFPNRKLFKYKNQI